MATDIYVPGTDVAGATPYRESEVFDIGEAPIDKRSTAGVRIV